VKISLFKHHCVRAIMNLVVLLICKLEEKAVKSPRLITALDVPYWAVLHPIASLITLSHMFC
jgi:hypothetical protein